MTPGQHFIISWVVANTETLDRKSRISITAMGLLPDIDGFGYVIDKAGKWFGYATTLYQEYHHYFGHNLLFGLLGSLVFAWSCRKRLTVFFLCLTAFHLHLLADLVGSRGPDGYQWPIPYFYPFSPLELTWDGQWELSSWLNSAIGVSFFVIALAIARYRHVTFFELFSTRFEKTVVETARRRGFLKNSENER